MGFTVNFLRFARSDFVCVLARLRGLKEGRAKGGRRGETAISPAMTTTPAAEDHDADDSVTSRIARGRSNYNAGLYKQAAEDFARLAEVDTAVGWKRNKRPRPEHSLSPQLAFEADAALCRARSSGTPESLKEALEINERYRRVLRGAETNRDVTVSTILLAAVSAIWLHMKLDDFGMARTVAWESLQWACSLVTNTRNAVWTEHGALKLLSRALPKSDHSVCTMTHALNILELASPQGTFGTNTTRMNVEFLKEEEESTSTSGEFIAKQHLIRALTLHRSYREGDSMAKQLRDEHLHRALNGTNLLLARKISTLIQGVEAIDENVCVDAVTEDLGQVLSRTNPAELNLWGCLLARSKTTIAKALVPLKEALELSESFGHSQLRRDIISNLAECFLFLGETRRTKDLLLYLNNTAKPEKECSLTNGSKMNLSVQDNGTDEHTILWRAFLTTTLDTDHIATMRMADKLLHSVSSPGHALLSHIFALLQAGRPTLALKAVQRERIAVTSPCSIASAMYEADAMLMAERGFDPSTSTGISRVALLADSANTRLALLSTNHSREARLLRAVVFNNRGISRLMEGKSDEALEFFRISVRALDLIGDHGGKLQPYFNLCLLLWRKQQTHDAVRIWLAARGIYDSPDKSQVGFDTYLKRAVGKYLAEQQRTNEKNKSTSSSRHVPNWLVNGLGCMDPIQVLLMDCIMVQCAIEMKDAQAVTSSLDELTRYMT